MNTHQQGWECPNCGKVYAPFVTECSACPPQIVTQAYTDPEPWHWVDNLGDPDNITWIHVNEGKQ